ncbi:hypothetical protein D6833_11170 [Candidatus Parcubacteria bacterium]|nr:MAG: hypothetical protein D6833_11170 [Candidatus Parcubacteria bacterium]
MKPSSRAALSVERVQSCDAETWQALFADYSALARGVADGGSALAAPFSRGGLSQQRDNFHAFRAFARSFVTQVEQHAYDRLAYEDACAHRLRDAALRSGKLLARGHIEAAQRLTATALDDLTCTGKAFRLLREAYEPLSACGRLKSRSQADASVQEAIRLLDGGQHTVIQRNARTKTTNSLTLCLG